jgi:hypothetical protein
MADATRYLVVIQLKEATKARVSKVVQLVKTELTRLSETAPELAFTSAMADCFGFFVKTNLGPAKITSAIKSPGPTISASTTILDGRDSIFALEIGQKFHTIDGFTRALTWLQRH